MALDNLKMAPANKVRGRPFRVKSAFRLMKKIVTAASDYDLCCSSYVRNWTVPALAKSQTAAAGLMPDSLPESVPHSTPHPLL